MHAGIWPQSVLAFYSLYYFIIIFIICVRRKKKTRVHCVLTTRNAFHKTKGAANTATWKKHHQQPYIETERNETNEKIRIRRHKENLQLTACAALWMRANEFSIEQIDEREYANELDNTCDCLVRDACADLLLLVVWILSGRASSHFIRDLLRRLADRFIKSSLNAMQWIHFAVQMPRLYVIRR